jgi:hypothetical protein
MELHPPFLVFGFLSALPALPLAAFGMVTDLRLTISERPRNSISMKNQ